MNISVVQTMIDAIDKPAIFINRHYIIEAVNTPYRQAYPLDITLGSSQCFKVSHGNNQPCDQCGEDCPMQRCDETRRSANVVHIHSSEKGYSYCDILMRPIYAADGELLGYLEVLERLEYASNLPDKGKLVGESLAFKSMLNKISRVAKTDISVLLQGETGTGKELVAQALHNSSTRGNKPFVVIECTGLADALFESELFGYEKGAFTGATSSKKGLVEAVHGGTLFFDEIGDVPVNMQVKLLRLLETKSYRPVGSVQLKQADFRLVCASHKNLQALVASGEFRRDLYYRIAGFPIDLPPLRERSEDIPLLCRHMLSNLATEKVFHPQALTAICHYPFPGNVRELKNLVEHAALLCDDDIIQLNDLPEYACALQQQPDDDAVIVTLAAAEERYLRKVIATYRGSIKDLAGQLNVSQRTLYRKLQALGLKVKC